MSGINSGLTPQQILDLSYKAKEESKEEAKERRLITNAHVSNYKDKGKNKKLSRILAGENRHPVRKEILALWKELFKAFR